MSAALRSLAPVLQLLRRAVLSVRIRYTRWALSEIWPLHEDVPPLALRLRNLEDELRALVRA